MTTRINTTISFLTKNKQIDILYITLLFLLVNGFLYFTNGIKVVCDSPRYLEYAQGLRDGFYIDPFNIWYLGYSSYILVLNTFTDELHGIVAGQYVFSFMAVLAVYFTSLKLWDRRLAALFSASLFILFFDIPVWNSYILAESLYTSFICLTVYCSIKVYKKEYRVWFIGILILMILFTISIKPTGIALLGAFGALLIYQLVLRINNKSISAGLILFVTGGFLLFLDLMLENYLILENYNQGEVIYAVKEVGEKYDISYLLLEVPSDLYQPRTNSSLLNIILFAIHHPFYWAKLTLYKVFFLFIHIRPYWSSFHNIFSLVVLMTSYYLFMRGIVYLWNHEVLPFIFTITYILLHAFSVGLTSNDWDGRFLIPILPVIILISGKGLSIIIASRQYWCSSAIMNSD